MLDRRLATEKNENVEWMVVDAYILLMLSHLFHVRIDQVVYCENE